jgi:monofunctional biosynthetic peptidoglycan transglycosylase
MTTDGSAAAGVRGVGELFRRASAWFRHPPVGDPEGSGEGSRGRIRWLRVFLVATVAATVLSVLLVYVVIPYPWTLATRNPDRTALMEQRVREARMRGDTLVLRQEWRPLSELSPNLVRAVVVAEDYRFWEHDGVDWVSLAEEVLWSGDDSFSWRSLSDLAALAEAVRYVRTHSDQVRGRSTLTQQLAKNLYFGTDRSFLRKGLELVVARRLERRLEKERILELYLNLVEWGPGIFGAEAAAQQYFGVSAGELTMNQAAAMAGTLPHPLTSNPARNPGQMRWRQDLILDRLFPEREPPPELPQPDTAR